MKRNLRTMFLLASAFACATVNAQTTSPSTPPATNQQGAADNMKNPKAQVQTYQAFIYTDSILGEDLGSMADEFYDKQKSNGDKRSVLSDMASSAVSAAKGIGSGYVTSAINLGVTAISNLFTKSKRQKEEWKKTVSEENKFETKIGTLNDVKDFYSTTSPYSPMDPAGMTFNGIGCIKKLGNDTVFYVSCHIDRSKLLNIINHSKFNLVLDTLIFSPYHSDLPNTKLDIPFSFKERKNFNLNIDIKVISSWINPNAVIMKDQELGEFVISVPVAENELKNGYLRYVRKEGETPKYAVTGESFVVPRSFMGFNDGENFHESFGTGEYQLEITLKETCDITDEFDKNWKADRDRHKSKKHDGFFKEAWKEVKSQNWNDITKTWVVTVIQGPASRLTQEVISNLHLSGGTTSTPALSTGTGNTGTQNVALTGNGAAPTGGPVM